MEKFVRGRMKVGEKFQIAIDSRKAGANTEAKARCVRESNSNDDDDYDNDNKFSSGGSSSDIYN